MRKDAQKLLAIACAAAGLAGVVPVQAVRAEVINQNALQTIHAPAPPVVKAQSVVLMDADNGQILYEKNADERRAPASTTKIMTMLLVMEAVANHKVRWEDEVPVTPDAYRVATTSDVSNAYLDPREHFTLRDMMDFIAVLSANDATVAVADKIGGDKDNFVAMMNQEAQRLGLTGTHYMNPDGLPQDNHYTTAMDLAKLSRYLIEHYPEVLEFTSKPTVTIKSQVRKQSDTWPNTDEMIGKYPGVDGLKTGFTDDAGYCFVGTAQRNGVRLISVVMGDTKNDIHQRFVDTQKLFDYGFQQFTETKAATHGQTLSYTVPVPDGKTTQLPVTAADDLIVDLPAGVQGQVKFVSQRVTAPVHQGQKVGTLEYVVNGSVIAQTDAVAAGEDPKANWFVRLLRGIGRWLGGLLHRL
ncbi:MAG: D-alanyl-D-alanine carboxypeptidase [Alicyclobacillus macrosporangiidus]|uniref:D-alanyl-D-alanine carboxypeptidase family protein n=1 Tax=Alicyclobacillus macrosporangiidus TaxID=392015 RepID=UPI0026EFBFE8|nr:D-alanyl-D-alanine carboxypeptidase family protein [Alicyclobacillus macrosporangiidus]MCL6599227.1 D-alanyl-D-alanine carboxypeptidase [Alicyclobacillus macrosporangiidus]